jgi:phage terminase large subunit-like protein
MSTKRKHAPASALRTRGEKVIAFIEKYCMTPEGKHIGLPMVLRPFQKRWILAVYDNPARTHTGVLSIARKNGKTALIAAILLAHLVGPEAVLNSQIVSGAMSKEQAAVVFELAVKMVELSPALVPLVKIFPSGKKLLGLHRNVLYRALAAEGKTAHGLSPILAIIDEMGQVVGPTDKFIAAIETAQGAYDNPLMLIISTQAPTDNDMLSQIIDAQEAANDPRVVCHVYSAPIYVKDAITGEDTEEEVPLDDPAGMAAANPALGDFRSLEDVQRQCKKAMAIPSFEPEYRNLILNQRVEAVAPFVPRSIWMANGAVPEQRARRRVYGGLDLSSVSDLTAAVLVDEDDGAVFPYFWLPEEGLSEKSKKDKVPYDVWAKDGKLQTTPGKAIQYRHVAQYLRRIFNEFEVILFGFDRYLMAFLKEWLRKEDPNTGKPLFTEEELDRFVDFGQGTASMTPALRDLEVKLLNAQLKHGNHPVLNMCAANAKVVGDSGARKFDKRRARGRIDGLVALAIAVGVMPQEAESTGGTLDDYLNDEVAA